ncbi:MAG: hypothetical protein ND895_09535 [Pyrinomonadaceae bacterium]|nr:hypothetical protein [Pyrinomonadaceae bacterium]
MDIKRFTSHRSSRRKGRKGDTADLAAQLAPLEEQSTPAAVKQVGIEPSAGNGQIVQDSGAIIVDKDLTHVPRDMMEEGGEKTFLGMEPVVLVILAVMLTFIAFIAWQISHMPAK